MSRTKLSKSKVHLLFGGGFVLAFVMSVAIKFLSGQGVFLSFIGAFGEIKPLEYVMFFLFWYWLARSRQTESRPKHPTVIPTS